MFKVKKLLKHIKNYVMPSINHAYARPPGTIYIAVNSRCNMKCRMCDVGSGVTDTHFYKNTVTGEELSLIDLCYFFEDVSSSFINKPTIAITSAEPLLYSQLFSVIKSAKTMGLKTQVTTNGLLLAKKAELIVLSGVDDLWVSIDGPRETHDKIRGVDGAFDAAMLGIKEVVKLYMIYRTFKPKIHINYTINDLNYDKIAEFMIYINNVHNAIPVRDVCFSHLNFVTPEMIDAYTAHREKTYDIAPSSLRNVNLSSIDTRRMYNSIKFVKNNFKNVYFTPDIEYDDMCRYYTDPLSFIPHYTKCNAPWRAGQVFSNGDVGVATRCFNVSFGNIKKEQFSDIWNGRKMIEFRNQLLSENNHSFPICSRCCGVF